MPPVLAWGDLDSQLEPQKLIGWEEGIINGMFLSTAAQRHIVRSTYSVGRTVRAGHSMKHITWRPFKFGLLALGML